MKSTAIVILVKNQSEYFARVLNEFKTFAKSYLGTSRYDKEETESEDGYKNVVCVKSILTEKEKKELIRFNPDLFVFFLEGEENSDIMDDNNTIFLKNNEDN